VSLLRKLHETRKRRTSRIRHKLFKTALVPRVSIFRSLNQIYAQIIDDAKQQTLASASSIELKDVSGDKKDIARQVGLKLAEKAKAVGIKQVVFDRGPYLYHGRVKSLAEGLREGGLTV